MSGDGRVHIVAWDGPHHDQVVAIRTSVFVHEQGYPLDGEFDAIDPDATTEHFLLIDDGRALGTGRLFPHSKRSDSAKIGRVAVVREERGKGRGLALMGAMLQGARERGFTRVEISAQVRAMPFYLQLGFVAYGPEYDDGGVPHRDMEWFPASG